MSIENTYGIAARNFTAYPEMPDARALVDYGVRVEELGYDSLWVWDHILLGVEPNFPVIESLTVLTAIAAVNTPCTEAPLSCICQPTNGAPSYSITSL